ncbi:hypothetical protein C7381_103173 [Ezakiella coagulans]|uniref:Uncharacterized protein n=1 Tax=Ezakiella coagulans TaxID=46507 RepID=A0A2U1E4Q3_9FIRM|nr:hypothetical protein [Ezakiella coagulans]PVY94934.1 hypothetical protein C7381_103173 [Ezakiella coagulans]
MKKVIDYFFETLTVTLTFYVVTCFSISFQSVLKVFVRVLNVALIANFYENLKCKYSKKAAALIVAISIVILIFMVYFIGYFKVDGTISKLR